MTEAKRLPGRPAHPEPSEDTAHIDVRLPPELRRRIRMAAAAADISMNAWVRQALLEKLERDRNQEQQP